MNVDRNIKVPDLILSTLLLSKTYIGLKHCFRKICTIFEFISNFIIALLTFFDEKEGTTILERVAFLLRLSIYPRGASGLSAVCDCGIS